MIKDCWHRIVNNLGEWYCQRTGKDCHYKDNQERKKECTYYKCELPTIIKGVIKNENFRD
jgi:hypothetical protein